MYNLFLCPELSNSKDRLQQILNQKFNNIVLKSDHNTYVYVMCFVIFYYYEKLGIEFPMICHQLWPYWTNQNHHWHHYLWGDVHATILRIEIPKFRNKLFCLNHSTDMPTILKLFKLIFSFNFCLGFKTLTSTLCRVENNLHFFYIYGTFKLVSLQTKQNLCNQFVQVPI